MESREKRGGGWFSKSREEERWWLGSGFLEKLINEFFISLYYFNVKYH